MVEEHQHRLNPDYAEACHDGGIHATYFGMKTRASIDCDRPRCDRLRFSIWVSGGFWLPKRMQIPRVGRGAAVARGGSWCCLVLHPVARYCLPFMITTFVLMASSSPSLSWPPAANEANVSIVPFATTRWTVTNQRERGDVVIADYQMSQTQPKYRGRQRAESREINSLYPT